MTMNRYIAITCFIVSMFTACIKPNTDIESNDNETIDTIVKKHLITTYLSDPDQPEKIIEWEEGYERISRIVTKPGNPSFEVAYDFEYYGDDSLRVIISLTQHSSFWFIGFSSFTCHLSKGRISTIDYYLFNTYQYTEEYSYDERGRLISVLNHGEHPHGNYYEWDGENVCSIKSLLSENNPQEYHAFCQHIDPEYSMPYVLFCGWTAQYGDGYLTKPLWKNCKKTHGMCLHHVDEDGYVTSAYFVNEEGDTISNTHYVYSK